MVSLINFLKDFCLTYGFHRTYWIAYSGGLDSHVLLHALSTLRLQHPLKLRAIHINHGLSVHATSWETHCASICEELKIELISKKIQFSAKNKSFEEVARDFRYQELKSYLESDDFLMTAHHKDDQAETVLLQMLRGAGPKGLAAMPVKKKLGKGFQVRPLLHFTREDLKKYAREHHLVWIEDESNSDNRFMRNFLRHEILPVLKKRLPNVTTTLSRVAENCAEAAAFIQTISKKDLAQLRGEHPNTLSIKKLLLHSDMTQRQLLRIWIHELNYPLPTATKLKQIQKDMLYAKKDRTPLVSWQGIELRRYDGNLYIMKTREPHDVNASYEWDLSCPLFIPSLGTLKPPLDKKIIAKKIRIHFRQGGEIIQLSNQKMHHSLKKLFQTWKVPPWERSRIPLISIEDKLIGVLGYFIREDYQFLFNNIIKFTSCS